MKGECSFLKAQESVLGDKVPQVLMLVGFYELFPGVLTFVFTSSILPLIEPGHLNDSTQNRLLTYSLYFFTISGRAHMSSRLRIVNSLIESNGYSRGHYPCNLGCMCAAYC